MLADDKEPKMNSRWIRGAVVVGSLFLAACGGTPDDNASGTNGDNGSTDTSGGGGGGDSEEGQEKFNGTCASCHGQDGVNPTVGKDLKKNTFVGGLDDKGLVDFIIEGRNDKGMPSKGGNPAFTEDDLFDIVAYIRTLQ